ncbi:helix-turn-helix domain-containing protein [Exiguobacterium sp. RIT594]|uniref:helix-turn-helix domain-containing protein n=1 Tax=Exiguobacterium sp. RIT594 TaxID=2282449 RepID=UPI000DF86727|nr:helix-turn-helix domain-containing protein [Exiguobacterium sp. RIT594]RDB33926.1 XRE family transcriptional regulator [Exiguobacterium sp. RIT594]
MNQLNISIGNEIKRIRQERNWTQAELCQGICSQAEISKIENGRNSPTVDLLQQLAERLEIPVSFLLENRKQQESIKKIDHTLLQLTREGNYEQILSYDITTGDRFHETTLLLEYYRIISEYRIDNYDYRTTSVQLSRLIEHNDIKYNYPDLYLRAKMAIAILYAENQEYRQAEKLYKELEETHFEFSNEKVIEQQLKIIYNHAKLLFKMGNFEESLTTALKGIHSSVLLSNASYIAHLYYQKGEVLEVLNGDGEETSQSYVIAYELFKAFHMTRYANTVKEVKRKFLFTE